MPMVTSLKKQVSATAPLLTSGRPIVRLTVKMELTGPDHYEEGLFKQKLLDVVNNHDPSTPLFLYYAPHIVHGPLQVPDSYLNKFSFIDNKNQQIYHAMVNYLDDVVGELVDALKKKGLWDNLLFMTSSDNGGPVHHGKEMVPITIH